MFSTSIALAALLVASAYAQCPDGWTKLINADKCIRGFPQKMNFIDALAQCETVGYGHGGSLVSVHNAFQNAQLLSAIRDTDPECYYWIGLYDSEDYHNFTWTDGSAVDYTNPAGDMYPATGQQSAGFTTQRLQGHWDFTYAFLDWDMCFICEQLIQGAPPTTARPTTARPLTTTTARTQKPVTDPTTEEPEFSTGDWDYCGDPYMYFFNGNCYDFWGAQYRKDAAELCGYMHNGGKLVSIHSDEEGEFVSTFNRGKSWLGLTRKTPSSAWLWDDGTPVDFLNWAQGHPRVNSTELCAVMQDGAHDPSAWQEQDCTKDYEAVACKFPPPMFGDEQFNSRRLGNSKA